jgi:hypothetical protein
MVRPSITTYLVVIATDVTLNAVLVAGVVAGTSGTCSGVLVLVTDLSSSARNVKISGITVPGVSCIIHTFG